MRVDKIAAGVWKLTDWPGLSSNVYVVKGKQLTLIDLGDGKYHSLLKRGLKKLGYKPEDVKRIIYTHLHFDHIGSPEKFPNAEFFASKEAIEDFQSGVMDRFLARLGIRKPKLKGIELKPVEKIRDFKVIRTPGHTRGSICLWMKGKRILFSGDTLFHRGIIGRTDLPNSVPEKMESSLKKLQRYKYRILCPGH